MNDEVESMDFGSIDDLMDDAKGSDDIQELKARIRELTDNNQQIEQKYKSLDGALAARDRELSELRQENSESRDKFLATLDGFKNLPQPTAPEEPKVYINDAEREQYGDILKMNGKQWKEEFAPEIQQQLNEIASPLLERINQLESQLSSVDQKVGDVDSRAQKYALSSAVSDLHSLEQDAEFQEYLNNRQMGIKRNVAWQSLKDWGDADGLKLFVEEYRQNTRQPEPSDPLPVGSSANTSSVVNGSMNPNDRFESELKKKLAHLQAEIKAGRDRIGNGAKIQKLLDTEAERSRETV